VLSELVDVKNLLAAMPVEVVAEIIRAAPRIAEQWRCGVGCATRAAVVPGRVAYYPIEVVRVLRLPSGMWRDENDRTSYGTRAAAMTAADARLGRDGWIVVSGIAEDVPGFKDREAPIHCAESVAQ
jgi:hypothetical protein